MSGSNAFFISLGHAFKLHCGPDPLHRAAPDSSEIRLRLRDVHGLLADVGRVPIADQDIWFTQVSLTSSSPASVIILATVSRGQ